MQINRLCFHLISAFFCVVFVSAEEVKKTNLSKEYFDYGNRIVYQKFYSFDDANSRMEGILIYKIGPNKYLQRTIWLASNLFHDSWRPKFTKYKASYQPEPNNTSCQIINGTTETLINCSAAAHQYTIKDHYVYPLVKDGIWATRPGSGKDAHTINGIDEDGVKIMINGIEYSKCIKVMSTMLLLEHDAREVSVSFEWIAPKLGEIKSISYSANENGIINDNFWESYLISSEYFEELPTKENLESIISKLQQKEEERFIKDQFDGLIKDNRYGKVRQRSQ